VRIFIGMSFCIWLPNFVVIRRSAAELLPHIDFNMAIYSFGDIVILIFCRFALKLLIDAHFAEFWGHISPEYSRPSF